jgi:predicted DNA-binding protein YlxM (UPF0122 family)
MSNLTLSEFLHLDPKDIDLAVTKFNSNILLTTYEIELKIPSKELNIIIQKRYTEFQGFYDSLTIRYQNLTFPEFPSKFQLINKNEKRKKFFDNLLKTVQQLACSHTQIKKDLMKLIYEFVIGSSHEFIAKSNSLNESGISQNCPRESVFSRFEDTKSVNISFK